MRNADAVEREKIAEIIVLSKYNNDDTLAILDGSRKIKSSSLDRETTAKLKKMYKSQGKDHREKRRKKKLDEICMWTLEQMMDHYCYFGGFCPITGLFIPLKYLSCER